MTRRWPVLAIFILSGAAGLIYEVVWARQLVLVFGNTTQAVSAILTGFFGGIAIGSVIGGRIADRAKRALRMYGLLELILVVVVLLTPVTFRLLHDVYRGAFQSLESSPTVLALIRFGLSLLALGPATILMGATLPTLTRHLSRDPANLSSSFGRLYAANTAGAIVGTIAAGFVLIELLGLTGTLLVGAACSAIAGVSALLLDWRRAPTEAAATLNPDDVPDRRRLELRTAGRPAAGSPGPDRRLRLGPDLARLPGPVDPTARLGHRRLDVRLHDDPDDLPDRPRARRGGLQRLSDPDQDAQPPGARPGRHRRARPARAWSTVIGRGVTGVLNLTTDFGSLFTDFALPVVLVVLPATFVMGLTFPAASALIADPDGHVGSNSGLLLSANTLGAITGTFLIPFVVIPLVGSPVALGLIALLNAGDGRRPGDRRPDRGSAAPPRDRRRRRRRLRRSWSCSLAVGGLFVDPSIARILGAGGTVAKSTEDDIASVQAGHARGLSTSSG